MTTTRITGWRNKPKPAQARPARPPTRQAAERNNAGHAFCPPILQPGDLKATRTTGIFASV